MYAVAQTDTHTFRAVHVHVPFHIHI